MSAAEAHRQRAAALRDEGARTCDPDTMLEAVAAARAALREDGGDPRSLALLGSAQAVLGEATGEAAWLEAAAESYRAAIAMSDGDERTRMHRNLGAVLALAGHLDGAIEHDQLAIQGYAEGSPDWAIAQTNLADALRILGERAGDADALHASAAASRAALTVMTHEAHPRDWAMATTNLANALLGLGSPARCAEAIALYEAALGALDDPRLASAVRHNLDRARSLMPR